jgi:hypothetical protein
MHRNESLGFQGLLLPSDKMKEKIYQDYVQPFLSWLEKLSLENNAKEIIQEMFRYLHNDKYLNTHKIFGCDRKTPSFFEDFDPRSRRDNFFQILKSHSGFTNSFYELLSLYQDALTKNRVFPQAHTEEVQTCIRELFYDYLNPLGELQAQIFKNAAVSSDKSSEITLGITSGVTSGITTSINNNLQSNYSLLNLNMDVQNNVYSFMDYQSRTFYGQTCKAAYFFNKANLNKTIKNKESQILYAIGDYIDVTESNQLFGLHWYNLMDIPQDHLLSSHKYGHFKAFHSLYQALEYSYDCASRSIYSERCGGMPSIWIVNYTGKFSDLKFRQVNLEINHYNESYLYALQKRRASVCYATLPKYTIQPLIAAVIFPNSDFASYKIVSSLDFMNGNYLDNKTSDGIDNDLKRNGCNVM